MSLCTLSLSHDGSGGKRCWIGRSRCDRPALNLAPRTTPSLPSISCSTIPRGQHFRFRSQDWMTTTSPTARVHFLSPCLKGPSQPHLCFCLHVRIWLLYFIRSLSKRRKITLKLLKIIKHTFRITARTKIIGIRFIMLNQ